MKRIVLLIAFCLSITIASGQYFGIKSNILYDATSTVNFGMEIGMGKKVTLDISGNYNNWSTFKNVDYKHWLVQPELRIWTCEKFNGSFFGIHAIGGKYDKAGGIELPFDIYPGLKDHRYTGDFYGGGISYGYQLILSPRWGLEFSLGLGYAHLKYDEYSDDGNIKLKSDLTKDYFGPTKVGLSLIYIIR